jgi:hypothetical protein
MFAVLFAKSPQSAFVMKHYLSFATVALALTPFVGPASALSIMAVSEEQPPQKKQKVEDGSDTVDIIVPDEQSENLAPWENRVSYQLHWVLSSANSPLRMAIYLLSLAPRLCFICQHSGTTKESAFISKASTMYSKNTSKKYCQRKRRRKQRRCAPTGEYLFHCAEKLSTCHFY